MKVSREESSRIHHEFEKFYAKYPQLRVQANHQIFLNAAEEDGGSEVLTAEWMELQLDSLRGQLAVLQETPDEALNRFIRENPAYDSEANRQIIAQRIRQTNETVQQAVFALETQLAFNQEVASEHTAQLEQQERAALVEEIALDYSPVEFAQNLQRRKLRHLDIEWLRAKAQEIKARRHFRSMTKEELKMHLRHQRDQNTPAPLELPAEFTPEKIRSLSVEEIKKLNRIYGHDVVNARLGYVKPEIGGMVRIVNMEI
jgi:hypothetical protein